MLNKVYCIASLLLPLQLLTTNCKETLPKREYEEPAGGQLLAEVHEEVHMATSGVARLVDLDTQDLGIYRTLSRSQNE